MGPRSIQASENQEFFSSGRWKCNKSPSGAHYWMVDNDQMTCKYCHARKSAIPHHFSLPKPETK